MSYGIKYTLTAYGNQSNQTVLVNIEQDGYVGASTALTGEGRSPISIQYDASEDNVLATIRGAVANVSILSSTIDATTFVSNSDTEWRVSIYRNSGLIYQGFLVQEETSQKLLFPPFSFTLQFNDGVVLLKDQSYGKTVYGLSGDINNSIAKVIGYCLRLTGLELPLRFFMNVWPL